MPSSSSSKPPRSSIAPRTTPATYDGSVNARPPRTRASRWNWHEGSRERAPRPSTRARAGVTQRRSAARRSTPSRGPPMRLPRSGSRKRAPRTSTLPRRAERSSRPSTGPWRRTHNARRRRPGGTPTMQMRRRGRRTDGTARKTWNAVPSRLSCAGTSSTRVRSSSMLVGRSTTLDKRPTTRKSAGSNSTPGPVAN